MRLHTRTSPGYSLIEVLIAFAIMMMVLAALLPAQTNLLASSHNTEDRQLVAEYALSRLAPLGVTAPLIPSDASGVYQGKWKWSEAVTLNPSSSPEYPVFDIAISITTLHDAPLAALFATRQGAK